jgi:hypothetical protein
MITNQHSQNVFKTFLYIRNQNISAGPKETKKLSDFCLACLRDKRGLQRKVLRYWLDQNGDQEYIYFLIDVFSSTD